MSKFYEDPYRYDDIINLPHHQSKERPHMSLHDRAAQFAPFAALTGYDDAIKETSRITNEEIILDESSIDILNEKIYMISHHLKEKWEVSITYFRKDVRKNGGSYLTDIGTIRNINEIEKMIIMDSGMEIPMDRIIEMEVLDRKKGKL